MKSIDDIKHKIEEASVSHPNQTPYTDGYIDALEWVLK
jgi:hypothetical protein